MTATTISIETVPQAPAAGTKTNGTSGKYNPRTYLSDRAKVTEIDGSECDKRESTQWGWVELMFFPSSWSDGLRRAGRCLLCKSILDLLKQRSPGSSCMPIFSPVNFLTNPPQCRPTQPRHLPIQLYYPQPQTSPWSSRVV